MRIVRVTNERSGAEVASWVAVADRWWRRAIGLLGRRALDWGEGLLLRPCSSIHTIGMRFPIDVAFLDPEGRIVSASTALRPGKLVKGAPGSNLTLELPSGTLHRTDTRKGDRLVFLEESL